MVIKRRSPNYPGIDLEQAVEVAGTLYQSVGRGQFTPADAAKAWKYNSAAGPVKTRLAALRQYGLVEGKKGDNPHLSGRGLTLILRNRASREHVQALREAALAPSLFEELHSSMPMAAPDALRQHLIVESNFTDDGANRFIEVYRAAIALAHLSEYDNMEAQTSSNYDDDNSNEEASEMTSAPPQVSHREPSPNQPSIDSDTRSVQIPLAGTAWATLYGAFPMSEQAWDQMMNMLEAMKPGLVESQPPELIAHELNEDDEEDG